MIMQITYPWSLDAFFIFFPSHFRSTRSRLPAPLGPTTIQCVVHNSHSAQNFLVFISCAFLRGVSGQRRARERFYDDERWDRFPVLSARFVDERYLAVHSSFIPLDALTIVKKRVLDYKNFKLFFPVSLIRLSRLDISFSVSEILCNE